MIGKHRVYNVFISIVGYQGLRLCLQLGTIRSLRVVGMYCKDI